MSKILFFFCAMIFSGCTRARPDLSLGYRYNQGHSSGGSSFLQAPKFVVMSYVPTASSNSYFNSQTSVGQIGISGCFSPSNSNKQVNYGSSGYSGAFGSFGGIGDSSFNAGYDASVKIQQGVEQSSIAPIVTKHFYVHSAPADDDDEDIVRHIQVGQPQKNYHVVFINTPSTHSTKAKIIADIAPTEEKTAIYILAKKNPDLDISAEVNPPTPLNSKPKVFFVKYKTPEEAVHAQHTIQAQYDALGGTSDISNEGQIPVSSVAGALQTSSGTNTQRTYLPANTKFNYKY